jgi:hypothetical protein
MADEKSFDVIAQAAGLKLDDAERQRMIEGYEGLQEFLARIPDGPLSPDEPAIAYVMPTTRVKR